MKRFRDIRDSTIEQDSEQAHKIFEELLKKNMSQSCAYSVAMSILSQVLFEMDARIREIVIDDLPISIRHGVDMVAVEELK